MGAGYNLQTYKDWFLHLTTEVYKSGSNVRVTDALFYHLINEAQRFVQDELEIVRSRDVTTDVEAGTSTYSIPKSEISEGRPIPNWPMGTKFYEVSFLDSSGNWRKLERVEWPITDETDTGTPTQWAYRRISAGREIDVYPVPDTSQTDGLRFYYAGLPEPLTRIYNPPIVGTHSRTISVTTGTYDMTPSGALIPLYHQYAQDEIGVKQNVQSDGEGVTDESPQRWYEIASWITVSPYTVTLSEKYVDPTVEEADLNGLIIAQVPDFELLYPGKFGMMLPTYAAALFFQASAPEKAASLFVSAMAQFGRFRHDEADMRPPGRQQTRVFPDNFIVDKILIIL